MSPEPWVQHPTVDGWLQRNQVASWRCNLLSTCCFLHLHRAPKETATFSGYILFPFKNDSHASCGCCSWQCGEVLGACFALVVLRAGRSEWNNNLQALCTQKRVWKTASQGDHAACPILTSVDSPPCNTEHTYINKSLKGLSKQWHHINHILLPLIWWRL